MAKRSLQASPQGIIRVKQALARKHLTQQIFAEQVGLKTRQPIGRFLAGKPIDRGIFMEICFQLDLDWQEIAIPASSFPPPERETLEGKEFEIDIWVQQVRSRYQKKLDAQCGTLQMWGVSKPIKIADIYINVNILKTLPSQQWLEIPDLVQNFDPSQDDFERWGLNQIAQERVAGIEAVATYSKLMVLGKPGTGKTTFLKFLALECSQGRFSPQRLPVFFCLKSFVEHLRYIQPQSQTPLIDHLYQEITSFGVEAAAVESLLEQGRLLILLDGFDEVAESKSEEVFQQIHQLSQRYYQNQIVLSSRLGGWPYRFSGFTEVEIADFTSQQIQAFANKYFLATSSNSQEEGLKKASLFIQQLEKNENRRIRELVTTPLLLNLTCLVFQAKAKFPAKRSKLYEEGLNLLLVKWDQAKGVKRDDVYWNLSLAEKIKLLNQIGFTSFEQGDYFFEQSKIQQYIADYLRLSPEGETDLVVLQLDSEVILQSLECQHGLLVERAHGIYSFAHLTFQEYFTARFITNHQALASNRNTLQQQLVRHLTERRWREVFLLTTEMLPNADDLLELMKQQIEQLIASDQKLQQFLGWVNEKSQSSFVESKPVAVRAFYFALALALNHYLAFALGMRHGTSSLLAVPYFPLPLFLSLAFKLDRELRVNRQLTFNLKVQSSNLPHLLELSRVHLLEQVIECALYFDLALVPERARELLQSIQSLKAQLPDSELDFPTSNSWWQEHGKAWREQLIRVLRVHRQFGHDWQFSEEQMRSLKQYWDANQLLVHCLKSDADVSASVYEEIEKTLLLPTATRQI